MHFKQHQVHEKVNNISFEGIKKFQLDPTCCIQTMLLVGERSILK